jgi:hypothetical protein
MTWRLAGSLRQLRAEVEDRWPGTTVWTIGDQAHAARASDHNPNAAGVVCAVDVVGVGPAGHLWTFLQETRDPRIKYLIHRGRFVSATNLPWKVQPYRGANPHNDHVHISVGRGPDGKSVRPDLYDDQAPWGLTATEEEDDVYVVKHGDTGERVARAQTILQAAGRTLNLTLLPKHGTDGGYGSETATAVDTIAKRAKLPTDGNIGMDVLVLDYCRMLLEADRRGTIGLDQEQADARYVRRGANVTLSLP